MPVQSSFAPLPPGAHITPPTPPEPPRPPPEMPPPDVPPVEPPFHDPEPSGPPIELPPGICRPKSRPSTDLPTGARRPAAIHLIESAASRLPGAAFQRACLGNALRQICP